MNKLLCPLALALAFLPLGCDEDDNMDSGNDTAADDGGNDESAGPADGGDGADDGPATSASMQTCDSSHQCINDVCECTTPGKEEQPCSNDEACVDECEVCM